jgi:glutaredoxin
MKENFNGIILFVSEHCKVCEKQKELFDKLKIKYTKVVCDDDPDYWIKNYNIDVLPETRIYEFGKSVWSRVDIIQNDDDIKFLENYI